MKLALLFIGIVFSSLFAQAQKSNLEVPVDSVYSKISTEFVEQLNFLNNRDIDGDSISDTIRFEYTGGAHCCYKLSIVLSSDSTEYTYPFEMDGGYITGSPDGSWPQHFNIQDYDNDGRVEVFVELETYNAEQNPIPNEWERLYGITSHYIVIDYDTKLNVINIPEYISIEQYFLSIKVGAPETDLFIFKKQVDSLTIKYGVKDKNGKLVILPILDSLTSFIQNVAIAYIYRQPHIINARGQILKLLNNYILIDTSFNSDGILLVADNTLSRYYYLNIKGEQINTDGYIDAHSFTEGLASVQLDNGKWGYIDKTNVWVLKPIYSSALPFENGKAMVEVDNTLKWINTKGEFVEQ